jgi:ABC-type transport system involved in cytochrome c biogenesis permease subunit
MCIRHFTRKKSVFATRAAVIGFGVLVALAISALHWSQRTKGSIHGVDTHGSLDQLVAASLVSRH